MKLDEVRKVLEEKCLTQTEENVYTYDNVEFLIKNINGYSMIIKTKMVEVEETNRKSLGLFDDCLLFYSNGRNFNISLNAIEKLTYVEWEKPKEEEPITIEPTADKLYELIKPFIIKVAKDIYKGIKNDTKN